MLVDKQYLHENENNHHLSEAKTAALWKERILNTTQQFANSIYPTQQFGIYFVAFVAIAGFSMVDRVVVV